MKLIQMIVQARKRLGCLLFGHWAKHVDQGDPRCVYCKKVCR